MEFLRFGSNIPGSYWGCCAVDIIQNFSFAPYAKASIQLVGGDSSSPLTRNRESLFAGPTYEDIFWQRLRIGTFDTRSMPNHAFIAILTDTQLKYSPGKDWLAILKKAGFEFVRTVGNSVYSGNSVGGNLTDSNRNYIFMLVRNIGHGGIKDQFKPPREWTELGDFVDEPWKYLERDTAFLTQKIRDEQRAIWDAMPNPPLMRESEVEAAKVPVTYSGVRGGRLPVLKDQLPKSRSKAKAVDPFAVDTV